jgi:hypothetical protein
VRRQQLQEIAEGAPVLVDDRPDRLAERRDVDVVVEPRAALGGLRDVLLGLGRPQLQLAVSAASRSPKYRSAVIWGLLSLTVSPSRTSVAPPPSSAPQPASGPARPAVAVAVVAIDRARKRRLSIGVPSEFPH